MKFIMLQITYSQSDFFLKQNVKTIIEKFIYIHKFHKNVFFFNIYKLYF